MQRVPAYRAARCGNNSIVVNRLGVKAALRLARKPKRLKGFTASGLKFAYYALPGGLWGSPGFPLRRSRPLAKVDSGVSPLSRFWVTGVIGRKHSVSAWAASHGTLADRSDHGLVSRHLQADFDGAQRHPEADRQHSEPQRRPAEIGSPPEGPGGPQDSEWANRIFNVVLATFLIVLAAPVFLGVALLVFVVDGRPVLYRGRRLGRNKRPFTMYKFRTLTRGASAALKGQLHSSRHSLEIPCGPFFRDTRLDELPQLFNVLRGDMNLFGPRPEREEVYNRLCRHLPGYDDRFAVRPGVLGRSQLFTPHSAPKRLRSVIDNSGLYPSRLRDLGFTLYTAITVGATATVRGASLLVQKAIRPGVFGIRPDRRSRPRLRPRSSFIQVREVLDAGSRARTVPVEFKRAQIVDVNDQALRFDSPIRLDLLSSTLEFKIEIRVKRWFFSHSVRVKTARCRGEVLQRRQTPDGWDYVVSYVPSSETSQYIVEQYLLRRSLSSPFTS